VPATIGLLKANSQLHCPWAIQRYGGDHEYRRIFSPLTPEQREDCGRCFPAGHASGGFALMSLYFVWRRRWLGLGLGLATGWAMGGYQMFKGAHFLSHTVVTMLLAWLAIEGIAAVLRVPPPAEAD
jgi:membrane-associated PAP2 superfamily phosphatase